MAGDLLFRVRIASCLHARERQNVIGSLAGLGRGPGDGAVVFAQHFEPRADVVSVANGRDDAQRGAAEGRAHLGDQLFKRVFLGTEGVGEIAVEAMGAPLA